MSSSTIIQELRDAEPIKYLTFSALTVRLYSFRLYLTIYTLTCFQFWVYDLVLGLPQEVRMLKRCKLTLPDVVYYISR